MKLFSGLLGLVIFVFVLCFAFSNLGEVTVTLWPLEGALQMPLYMIGLVPLAFGLLFGGFIGWLGALTHKLRARRLARDLDTLNSRLTELQQPLTHPTVKKHFWERS